MTGPTVLLIHPTIREVGVATLKESAQVYLAPDGREDTLVREANACRADALIVRVEQATRALFQQAPSLKIVGMHGVGTDAIDVDAATEAGVLVLNAPRVNYVSTAEHTLALLLAVAKNVACGDLAVRRGEFTAFRESRLPMEIAGRTLFVVGLGRVGSEVARKCRAAFDMRVLACDPLYDRQAMAAQGVEWTSFERGLAGADFVSLHVPLKADTRGMMDRRAFAAMKPGAVLLNLSRGAVVDQAALVDVLRSGHLAGAGLDVFDPEPVAEGDALTLLPRVVLSPHYAGDTVSARDRCSRTIARSVLAAWAGEPVDGVVNPEVLRSPRLRLSRAPRFS